MRTCLRIGALAALLALVGVVHGDDWPQWRGPDRTGVSKEKGLLKVWPKSGPNLLWTSEAAGTGFSSPAVVGDRIYIMGALGKKGDSVEYLLALDGKDKGKKLWQVPLGPPHDFKGNVWVNGPNATPTVDGNLIYGLGSQGELICVDAAKGDVKWRKNLPKDLDAQVNPVTGDVKNIGWGYSWSPLVDGDNLILATGGPKGLLTAVKKTTGALVWRSKDVTDQATYSSPIKAVIDGVPQYIYVAQENVYGIDARTGGLLWKYEKERTADEIVAPTPIYHNGHVFFTAGAAGAELIKVAKVGAKFTAKQVWESKKFANMLGGVVLVGKHLYGCGPRTWNCVDFATGDITWNSRKPGVGSLIAADGHLYCFSEDEGTVTLVEASPEEFRIKGQFELPKKSTLGKSNAKLWTHPLIANGKLYLRDQELLFCYEVK